MAVSKNHNLQKISILNKCCLWTFYSSMNTEKKEKYQSFYKNIKQHNFYQQ